MEQGWVAIYRSMHAHEINVLHAMLVEHGIEAVIMNKQDSMHIHLNQSSDVELMVAPQDVIRAKHLIENQLS